MDRGELAAPGAALYRGAAGIFHALRRREGSRVGYGAEQPLTPPGGGRGEHRAAICVLRHQDILEDVLVDSGFFTTHNLPPDLTSLVLVLLYEIHKQKFNQLPFLGSDDEAGKEVTEVANLIYSHRTKLAAAFARVRIRKEVSSISCLLPESIQKRQEMAGSVPFCAWVNIMKIRMEDAVGALGQLGLSQVQKRSQLRGTTFLLDKECGDVIVFPAGLLDQLCSSILCSSKRLVIQDRSRCVLAHCARTVLTSGEDILFTTAGSGLTPVHVAVLGEDEGGKVLACGGPETNSRMEELRNLPKDMGVSKVAFIPGSFLDLQPPDPRIQRVKVIVVMLAGSASGVMDPMDFLLTEGEDIGLMRYLAHGPVPPEMVQMFADQHLELLLHAMKFPNVHSILYSTNSVHEGENQEVLDQALTKQPERNSPEMVYSVSESVIDPNYQVSHRWKSCVLLCLTARASGTGFPPDCYGLPRVLTPPLVFKPSSSELLTKAEDPALKVCPSIDSNGYFLAQLARQGITVKGILARAIKKGLLDKDMLNLPEDELDKVTKRGLRVSLAPKQGNLGSPKKPTQSHLRKKPSMQKPSRKRLDLPQGTQRTMGTEKPVTSSNHKEYAEEGKVNEAPKNDAVWLRPPTRYNNSQVLPRSLTTRRLLNRGQCRDGEQKKSTQPDIQRVVEGLDPFQSTEDFLKLLEDRSTRNDIPIKTPLLKKILRGQEEHNTSGSFSTGHKIVHVDLRRHSAAEKESDYKGEKYITDRSQLGSLVPKKNLANSIGTAGIQTIPGRCAGMENMDSVNPFPPVDSSQDLHAFSLISMPHSARDIANKGWLDTRTQLNKGSQSLNMQRPSGRFQVLPISHIYLPPPELGFLNVLKKQRTITLRKSDIL